MAESVTPSPRMLAQLGRTARFSGERPPYDDPGSLPYRAWLVWSATRLKAVGTNNELEGIKGRIFTGALSSVMWHLFPEQAKLTDDEKIAFQKEIRVFLRASHNAVCTDKNPQKPVWWIRNTWNDELNTSAPPPRYVATHTERKVTTSEAGEDRAPAPVTVRRIPACNDPTPDTMCGIDSQWFGEITRSLRKTPNSALAVVIDDIKTKTQSFIPSDFTRDGKINKTNVSNSLNTLMDAGIVQLDRPARHSGSGSRESQWSLVPGRDLTLTEIVKFVASDEDVDWYVPRGELTALDVLPNDVWLTASELAKIIIATRTRLYNLLHTLEQRGLIVRDSSSKMSRWKKVLKELPIDTNDHVPDATERSVDGSSDVDTISHLIEQIIADRVESATVELRTKYDQAVRERDELRAALAPLRNLLKS